MGSLLQASEPLDRQSCLLILMVTAEQSIFRLIPMGDMLYIPSLSCSFYSITLAVESISENNLPCHLEENTLGV